jgi:hypothetical protein
MVWNIPAAVRQEPTTFRLLRLVPQSIPVAWPRGLFYSAAASLMLRHGLFSKHRRPKVAEESPWIFSTSEKFRIFTTIS